MGKPLMFSACRACPCVGHGLHEYDPGGNRTRKINAATGREVRYVYDWSNPGLSSSNNNRLLSSQEMLTAPPNTVYSTTWYIYNCAGNVERVVTQNAGSTQYSATRFSYAKNQRAVSFSLAETWDPDGGDAGSEVDNYAVQWLREFRYDSGRARYLDRKFTGASVTANPSNVAGWVVESAVWTDYEGDEPYGDFAIVNSGSWFASNQRSYEPGVAKVDPWTSGGSANSKYYHTDHLGTTRTMSNSTGFDGGTRVLTAFGEKIAGPTPPDRYGYVGAHGYQTHDDLPFQHVGARYYDPGSGRFLQRDPIGVFGGVNTYSYAAGAPLFYIDAGGEAYYPVNPNPGGGWLSPPSPGPGHKLYPWGWVPKLPKPKPKPRIPKSPVAIAICVGAAGGAGINRYTEKKTGKTASENFADHWFGIITGECPGCD